MRHTFLLIGTLVALAAGCDGGALLGRGTDELTLDQARARWADSRPTEYQFTYRRACFCASVERLRVTVRNDSVVSAVELSTGRILSEQERAGLDTIDDLFGIIADAIDRDAADLRVTYDELRGFPREIILDYSAGIADDEFLYEVAELASTRLSALR